MAHLLAIQTTISNTRSLGPREGCFKGYPVSTLRLLILHLVGLTTFTFGALLADNKAPSDVWKQLASIPDKTGLAGGFAGRSGDSIIFAGGANFPARKPWEGGQKVWHRSVYATPDNLNGDWHEVGSLSQPRAYGVTVQTEQGLLLIGGNNANSHLASVVRIALMEGKIIEIQEPSLPIAIAQSAGARLGLQALVYGGSSEPGEKSALNRLFALDLSSSKRSWRELEPCPGQARILPVAAAAMGKFYIAGGASIEIVAGKPARRYLKDVWCYEPGKGWKTAPSLPGPIAASPSPAPSDQEGFQILGGDDGTQFNLKDPQDHSGFSRKRIKFNFSSNSWSQLSEVPSAVVTTTIVAINGGWVIPSGEVRPGIRTPDVWFLGQKMPSKLGKESE